MGSINTTLLKILSGFMGEEKYSDIAARIVLLKIRTRRELAASSSFD
jgi:hypothetical protein